MARDGYAEDPEFTRPGDMYDVRLESLDDFIDRRQMTQICRIESQIFL